MTVDRKLLHLAREARKDHIEAILLRVNGSQDAINQLANYVEEEVQLATIDLERRFTTTNRIMTDSRWRRVSQILEKALDTVLKGGDHFEKLASAEKQLGQKYAKILRRELRSGNVYLGSDETDELRQLELKVAGLEINTGVVTDKLNDLKEPLAHLSFVRNVLLDNLTQARAAEKESKSIVLSKVV